MKGKFLPPYYCLPFQWTIWKLQVWSVHTSFILLVVQHGSWFYFMISTPSWWCLNKYIFMSTGLEKCITDVLPLDGQEVIQLACFISPENACLGFSVWCQCACSLCLTSPWMVEDLWTEEPSVQWHTVTHPFYFVTQPVNNTKHCVVFWVGGICPIIYFQVVDIATFCLTTFKHFDSIFMGLSFDINMKGYTPLKWAYCLVSSQLFFWCVDVLKFCVERVNNWPDFEYWVIVWLSYSCLCIIVIQIEHCQ